jgi:hypothetical protein
MRGEANFTRLPDLPPSCSDAQATAAGSPSRIRGPTTMDLRVGRRGGTVQVDGFAASVKVLCLVLVISDNT